MGLLNWIRQKAAKEEPLLLEKGMSKEQAKLCKVLDEVVVKFEAAIEAASATPPRYFNVDKEVAHTYGAVMSALSTVVSSGIPTTFLTETVDRISKGIETVEDKALIGRTSIDLNGEFVGTDKGTPIALDRAVTSHKTVWDHPVVCGARGGTRTHTPD